MARDQIHPGGFDRVERRGELQVTLAMPTTRYFDQFLRMRCREELSRNALFPDGKELTESFAATDALLHLVGLDRTSTGVTVIVVGDGASPRTAATIALRSKWQVLSIDPALRLDRVQRWPLRIDRLDLVKSRIQALTQRLEGPTAVVVVHAHARLERAVAAVERCGGEVVAAVAIPCCGWVHEAPGLPLVADFTDWGIWSPERRVLAWAR